MPEIHGIDVSHWNPVSDEAAVPALPVMSMKATEGATFVSRKFRYFWDLFGAKRAQRPVARGAYHWIRSDTSIEAQVNNLAYWVGTAGGLGPGDFIQLDWETTPNIPFVTLAQVEEWIDRAEALWPGRIIVYASDWVPHFGEWRQRHPDYPLWYANYNTSTRSSGGWVESEKYDAAIWQWSSTTLVPGFADGIDVNHVFDWDVIERISRAGLPEASSPAPVPTPAPVTEEDYEGMKIKVQEPGVDVWFEKVGVDVRRVGSGDEYAGLPGNEVVLDRAEFARLVQTSRHTYGDLTPEQATALGAEVASAWVAHHEQPITVTVPPVEVVVPPATLEIVVRQV
jgi:GH25 family lysozyme M1 (1,4-beta-N-acetylmuramidase)